MKRKTYRLQAKGNVFKPKSQRNKTISDRYFTARQIRGSRRWKDLAKMYKRHHPLCQYCRKKPSAELHHIEPLSDAPELAYNLDNLIALCVDCHDIGHTRRNRGEDVDTEYRQKKKEDSDTEM